MRNASLLTAKRCYFRFVIKINKKATVTAFINASSERSCHVTSSFRRNNHRQIATLPNLLTLTAILTLTLTISAAVANTGIVGELVHKRSRWVYELSRTGSCGRFIRELGYRKRSRIICSTFFRVRRLTLSLKIFRAPVISRIKRLQRPTLQS